MNRVPHCFDDSSKVLTRGKLYAWPLWQWKKPRWAAGRRVAVPESGKVEATGSFTPAMTSHASGSSLGTISAPACVHGK